ncbi:MAG: hypothetical protein QOI30_2128, partial [Mycobacterium sp.]|nr:hypothetical protein [Mycobacterium sp.]
MGVLRRDHVARHMSRGRLALAAAEATPTRI